MRHFESAANASSLLTKTLQYWNALGPKWPWYSEALPKAVDLAGSERSR